MTRDLIIMYNEVLLQSAAQREPYMQESLLDN